MELNLFDISRNALTILLELQFYGLCSVTVKIKKIILVL